MLERLDLGQEAAVGASPREDSRLECLVGEVGDLASNPAIQKLFSHRCLEEREEILSCRRQEGAEECLGGWEEWVVWEEGIRLHQWVVDSKMEVRRNDHESQSRSRNRFLSLSPTSTRERRRR